MIKQNRRRSSPQIVGQGIGQVSLTFSFNGPFRQSNEKLQKLHDAIHSGFALGGRLIFSKDRKSPHGLFTGPSCSSEGIRIFTQKYLKKKSQRACLITFYGQFCQKSNPDEIISIVQELMHKFDLNDVLISRLDSFADFINLEVNWDWEGKIYTQLKGNCHMPLRSTGQLETLTFGSKSTCQFTTYNKTVEFIQKGRNIQEIYPHIAENSIVWRMETRVTGKWLRRKKRGFRDAFEAIRNHSHILKRTMTHTIYLRGRPDGISPIWKQLTSAIDSVELKPEPLKDPLFDRDREARTCVGYAARFAAGINEPDYETATLLAYKNFVSTKGDWDQLFSEKRNNFFNA